MRLAVALASLTIVFSPMTSSAESLAVIVHVDRLISLDREAVAQIFLKRRRFWNDGTAIVPINRDAVSQARSVFESFVFGEGARRRLSLYWHRAYFRGVLPPATLASDAAVMRFVATEPRAIGYVPSSQLDGTVRTLLVLAASRPGSRPEPAQPGGGGEAPH